MSSFPLTPESVQVQGVDSGPPQNLNSVLTQFGASIPDSDVAARPWLRQGSRVIEQFDPVSVVCELDRCDMRKWSQLRQDLQQMSVDELRGQNARWHSNLMTFDAAVAHAWVIHEEFTSRGIAPAWRGVSWTGSPSYSIPQAPLQAHGPGALRRIGAKARHGLLMRWIDLAWLRQLLGPSHVAKLAGWREAFTGSDKEAHRAFLQIFRLRSVNSGQVAATPSHVILDLLAIPDLHRRGLLGLIDKDSAALRRNAEKRVEEKVKPKLLKLKTRETHPLTEAQVQARLLSAHALELAAGVPGPAATVYEWMTGCSITPQSMFDARKKIAAQCGLTQRAWRGTRAG
jgi:hypothetical protein